MNEDFVSFEIAKKLKEKGYPQHIAEYAYIVDNYGEDEYEIGDRLPIPLIPDYMDDVASPSISQVLKWLRKEKKIHIEVMFIGPTPNRVKYYITNIGGNRSFMDVADEHYETWEQATLAGIEYVLDNLI